ncbi:CRISPR-associated protein Cmr4 [Oceanotoga teriensis]|uniref:CRISPR-associated protein Cmr4 n=1 Tax=Oceanotoga teriensis TaxID=515440 RepID=A0AA45C5T2_9BACT|nr:type III-B CRISPR module RAMP protein Cmr4 [Oceanotoga teriensis]PWJ90017.1 CRISPR-associated protein Cmr4 [Oceanotoga teriensis]
MYDNAKMIYIKTLTPTHAGAGQTLQNVDMPIQRETNTNIPKIEGSSLKGSIKHSIYRKIKINEKDVNEEDVNEEEKMLNKIFGNDNGDSASRIGFTDAKLLFFPIKSTTEIYKLITCPYVLKRWVEDLEYCEKEDLNYINFDSIKSISISEGECISLNKGSQVLEEYIFENNENNKNKINEITEILKKFDIEISEIEKRIVILNDTDFIDLVSMYTEIITRNRIDPKKGVAENKGLFTEEYLPTETIMYFMALSSPDFFEKVDETSINPFDYLEKELDYVFHVGGYSTIGKGLVKRTKITKTANKPDNSENEDGGK